MLVFAVGVVVANSAPGRSFPSLLIVLYVAWAGQVVGNVLLGASLSAFVGALVMTPVATWVSRLPHALPPHASFLPGFWLLVPGALGLIGLTQVAGDAGSAGVQELGNTVASIFAVAVGVLCGTLLLARWTSTGRAIGSLGESASIRARWRTDRADTSSPMNARRGTVLVGDALPHRRSATSPILIRRWAPTTSTTMVRTGERQRAAATRTGGTCRRARGRWRARP